MQLIATLFFLFFALGAGAAATADEILQQVPERIRDFREKVSYGKFNNTADELDKKWQYLRFLERLIQEINEEAASGNALSAEDIKAIGSFARLTVILRDDYVPSTFRGASGFEKREVNEMIGLHEEVVRRLVPGIGRHLSLFRNNEEDWDAQKESAWMERFKNATEKKE